jgi:ankyrin repeat protein
MVRLLVENKADVNHRTPIDMLPMNTKYDKTYFSEGDYENEYSDEQDDRDVEKSIRIFNYLIEKGADLNILGRGGISFLGYCAFNSYIHFMNLALDNGADINIRENIENYGKVDGKVVVEHIEYGVTPLMSAADNGSYNSVKFLLDKGALIDLQDDKGNTALMKASYFPDGFDQNEKLTKEFGKVIKLLIERGADVNIKNKEGKTAYEITRNPKLKRLFTASKFKKEKGSEKCGNSFSVFDQQDHSELEEVFVFEKDGVFYCYVLDELEFLYKNKDKKNARGDNNTLDPVVPFRYKFLTEDDFDEIKEIIS